MKYMIVKRNNNGSISIWAETESMIYPSTTYMLCSLNHAIGDYRRKFGLKGVHFTYINL